LLAIFLALWGAASVWNYVEFTPTTREDMDAQVLALPRVEVASSTLLGF